MKLWLAHNRYNNFRLKCGWVIYFSSSSVTCIIFFGLRLKERGKKEETFSRRALADRARADATAGLKHRVQISLKTKQILFYYKNPDGTIYFKLSIFCKWIFRTETRTENCSKIAVTSIKTAFQIWKKQQNRYVSFNLCLIRPTSQTFNFRRRKL